MGDHERECGRRLSYHSSLLCLDVFVHTGGLPLDAEQLEAVTSDLQIARLSYGYGELDGYRMRAVSIHPSVHHPSIHPSLFPSVLLATSLLCSVTFVEARLRRPSVTTCCVLSQILGLQEHCLGEEGDPRVGQKVVGLAQES